MFHGRPNNHNKVDEDISDELPGPSFRKEKAQLSSEFELKS